MGRVDRVSVWYCPGCSGAMGEVVNGELELSGFQVYTSGTSLIVVCPECSREKTWYPQLSLEQLVRIFARELERLKT